MTRWSALLAGLLGAVVSPLSQALTADSPSTAPFVLSASGSMTDVPHWAERPAITAEASLRPRYLVLVQTRGEVVDVSADGTVRRRRGTLEPEQIDAVRQSLEAVSNLIQATTPSVRPTWVVRVDDEPVRVRVDETGPVLDADRLSTTVAPFINQVPFEAEDSVDRGPFNGVFVVTALPAAGNAVALVEGTPAAWVPAYTANAATEPKALATRFADQWRRMIALRSVALGWPSLPPEALSPAEWTPLLALGAPVDADYRLRKWPQFTGPIARSALGDSPWSRLPALPSDELTRALARASRDSRAFPRLDGAYDPRYEAVDVLGQRDGAVVIAIRADALPEVLRRWPSERPLNFLGQTQAQGTTVAVVTSTGPLPVTEAELLGAPGPHPDVRATSITRWDRGDEVWFRVALAGVPGTTLRGLVEDAEGVDRAEGDATIASDGTAVVTFRMPSRPAPATLILAPGVSLPLPNQAEPTPFTSQSANASGRLSVSNLTDGETGVRVTETGAWRDGSVRWSAPVGTAWVSLTDLPVLRIRVRRNARDPFALRLLDGQGQPVGQLILGTPYPAPREEGEAGPPETSGIPTRVVDLANDNAWTDLTIRLAEFVPETTGIGGLEVAPAPGFGRHERLQNGRGTLDLADVRFEALPPSGTVLPSTPLKPVEPTPTVIVPADRLAGLASTDDAVVLKTLELLRREPDESALDALVAIGRGSNVTRAELAMDAIAAIPGDAATAALNDLAGKAAFEPNRAAALRALVRTQRPVPLANAGTLFTARTRAAREAALDALVQSSDREANMIALALLRDASAEVRLRAVQGALVSQELANRRLLFTAVNDPNEVVRRTARVRLLDSPIPEIRAEAASGVADDAPSIRLAVLDGMRRVPKDEWLPYLTRAASDPLADVRAMALRARATLAAPVTPEQLRRWASDPDPRVQAALLDVLVNGPWTLDPAGWEALRQSVDPDVARRAREAQP